MRNLNNEFGLPLSVIGSDSPGRSIFGWLGVFAKAYWQLWFGSFPKILVLEMGVDKPGDMDYLLSIAKPDIAVITNIGISHYEFFKSREAVLAEKGKLAQAVSGQGAVLVNADNEGALQIGRSCSGKVIGYGFGKDSDVRLQIEQEKFIVPAESQVVVHTPTQDFRVIVAGIGMPHLSSAGAGIAVGLYLNMPIEKIQKGLRSYKPVAGRLNLINGLRKTLIIDDSYNASPDSVVEALHILARMPHQHKVAVLGDMLELGELSESSHRHIGELAASLNLDGLVVVGAEARIIGEAASRAGMDPELIKFFNNSEDAANYMRERVVPESAILIKGSQGARMEKVSKELLADPMSAANVLPRQYGKWLEK